jgi:hypothetical protein
MSFFQKVREAFGLGTGAENPIDSLDGVLLEETIAIYELNKAQIEFDEISEDLELKKSACNTLIEKGNENGQYNKNAIEKKIEKLTTIFLNERQIIFDRLNEIRAIKASLENKVLAKAVEFTALLDDSKQAHLYDLMNEWGETGIIAGEEIDSHPLAIVKAIDEVSDGFFQKAKAAQVGDIHTWGSGKFQKTSSGWTPVKSGKPEKKHSTQEIVAHAENTSSAQLKKVAVDASKDVHIRDAAKREIERRNADKDTEKRQWAREDKVRAKDKEDEAMVKKAEAKVKAKERAEQEQKEKIEQERKAKERSDKRKADVLNYALDPDKEYYVRYSNNIKDDLKRGWSSWNFGQDGFHGKADDLIDKFEHIKENGGGEFSISGFNFWIDDSSSINSYWIGEGKDSYKEIKINASEVGVIRELKSNYWVLVDNVNAKGGISAHVLPNNLKDLRSAVGHINKNKSKFDGTGDGESFDPHDSRVIYSNGSMHIIEKSEDDMLFNNVYNDDILKSKHYEYVKINRDGKIFYQRRNVGTDNLEIKTDFESQKKEIEEQAAKAGLKISFSGRSDSNGLSLYFRDIDGIKYRFSDHSVSNKDRMVNEKHFALPFVKTMGVGGNVKEVYNELFSESELKRNGLDLKKPELTQVKPKKKKKKKDLLVKYTPSEDLHPDHSKIEKDFGKYLNNKFKEAKIRYEAKFGNVLNVDNARELSDVYESNRSELSSAVHEPASAFIKKLYADKLAEETPEGKRNMILFTAGGTGAGKTTGIQQSGLKKDLDRAHVIFDTNMNGYDSSVKKVDQALAAGKNVKIAYTFRDPVDAFQNGAVPRSLRIGRTVPIADHVNTHLGSMDTMIRMAEKYKDNPKVKISVIDNSRGAGNAVLSGMEFVRKKNKLYNATELREQLHKINQGLYEQGKITDSHFRGFKGNG